MFIFVFLKIDSGMFPDSQVLKSYPSLALLGDGGSFKWGPRGRPPGHRRCTFEEESRTPDALLPRSLSFLAMRWRAGIHRDEFDPVLEVAKVPFFTG